MNRQLLLDVLPVPAPSFNNFIVGLNYPALNALRTLTSGRALYLWGANGCGRTHLLLAATSSVHNQRACYISITQPSSLLFELANTYAHAHMPTIIAVDDVHRMNEEQQAGLFSLYNRWREAASSEQAFALILAGDCAAQTMPLRDDLRSRLGWDLIFRLEPLSDDEKLAALSAQAAERGLQISPEVLSWMLTHYERNMGQLTALLEALDRYSLTTGRPLTLPVLRAMLAESSSKQ